MRFSLPSPSLPDEIISHYVWQYLRFPLSFQDVEVVPQIPQTYANQPRHNSPRRAVAPRRSVPQNQRASPFRWREVDQDGDMLDILVQHQRDTKAAKTFSRKLVRDCERSQCDHYRQAEELQRREGRGLAKCRLLPGQVAEQPSGEFSSANQVAGAADETVQVSRTRATASSQPSESLTPIYEWGDICAELMVIEKGMNKIGRAHV